MQKKYSLALLAAGLALGANSAHAGPHGYDLHNTLAPASAGLAGTSIATPQDNVSALFGNPATLAKFPGTEFTLGVSFYQPEARLRHDGSVTGEAFSARSDQGIYPIPQIAVTHDFEDRGLPVTAGLGLTATTGIGPVVLDRATRPRYGRDSSPPCARRRRIRPSAPAPRQTDRGLRDARRSPRP